MTMTPYESDAFEAMRHILLMQRKAVEDSNNSFWGKRRKLGNMLVVLHSNPHGFAHKSIEMAERVKPAPPWKLWRVFTP